MESKLHKRGRVIGSEIGETFFVQVHIKGDLSWLSIQTSSVYLL